ncbi:CPK2 [Symbiodinium sp. KB8]|nr:CPK2 [Symbiodinium sp. KB8]
MSVETVEEPRNEGEVDVGHELGQLLRQEVDEALRDVDSRTNTTFVSTVCPCCPWRRFDKRAYLRQHLRSQHTEAKRYCPSGTKQLRIASALYDHDAITRKSMQTGLLARSAGIIRSDVKPPVPTKIVQIDNTVRSVMDDSGPRSMAFHSVKKRHDLRRVGNSYTYTFACAFLQAAVAGNGSLQRIFTIFLGNCTRHSDQMSSLIPLATNGFWMNVLEDLMYSEPFQQYRRALLDECREHDEFRYIRIGATFKINLKVIGQASFHSSQSARENAVIPQNEAGYRTLTCRSRTGAAVRVVRSEKAAVVADTLANLLTANQMFQVLSKVLPHLTSIAVDAMHIVMVYHQNMNNKKTHGSRWPALIMDKFRKRDPVRTAASWGAWYTGQALHTSSADVRAMRQRLENRDMSMAHAYQHLEGIDPNQPWLTEIDFLDTVPAHLSLFFDEVQKTTFTGASLQRLIIRGLADQGAAAMHKGTLEMKLDFFQFVKVFSHNQALYSPLQRQVSQAEVARRAFKANVKVILTWCQQLAVHGAAPARAGLKILKQGRALML